MTPEEFINNLADTIARKLGVAKSEPKDESVIQQQRVQLARQRLQVVKETEELLGRFDHATQDIIRQQTAADIGYNVPNAPTWNEVDRWYAAPKKSGINRLLESEEN